MIAIRKIKPIFLQELRLLAVGSLIGAVTGVLVTFFNLLAEIVTEFSENIYEGIQSKPAFVPLLFFVLALSAFGMGVLVHFIPMVGGNGIPQIEGASKGLLKMKWYQVLPAMAAASLYCMFVGIEAGQECTSMFLGGAIGDGVGHALNSSDMERRYHITGGACAGLAVASNAPLTGILFAFEEAHRRFTPGIFICGFSSAVVATVTRTLLFWGLNMPVTSIFTAFALSDLPLIGYLFAALASLVTALIAVLFCKLCMLVKRGLDKITCLKGCVKYLFPFLFAGVAGLITIYAVGGGHSLIETLATGGGTRELQLRSLLSSPVAVTLLVILILRFICTCLNIGSGMPCGVFVPMIAIGALIGALMSRLCALMGMDTVYSDCIVVICMATFFATAVKAPLTAIVMTVEFTWQFTALAPTVLGVAIGYVLGHVFRTKPLYDVLLEDMDEAQNGHKKYVRYVTRVVEGSAAEHRAIRDVLWQDNVHVRSISRAGVPILPSSDARLIDGDEITFEAEVSDTEEFEKVIEEIVKPYPHFKRHKKISMPAESCQETADNAQNAATEGSRDVTADEASSSKSTDPVQTVISDEISANKDDTPSVNGAPDER